MRVSVSWLRLARSIGTLEQNDVRLFGYDSVYFAIFFRLVSSSLRDHCRLCAYMYT